jgi:HD-like signal output (HDOD) protein
MTGGEHTTTSVTPPLSPEAEAFVAAVGSATNLPAFVRNVRAIANVASNLEARVEQLEHAITQDVALSAKVLRIANSVTMTGGAGTSGSVASVKQAIMLPGYDRVQHLSTASSVFEKIDRDAPSTRDLMVESVLAANQSLHLAIAAGFEAPELAYLCGLFRRLGEVLVACYRAPAYRRWLETCALRETVRDGDEQGHFGFTFAEVGMALARKWGIPPAVVRTMRPCETMTPDGDLLHMITQSSADLARALYGAAPAAVDAAAFPAHLAGALGVESQTLADALQESVADAKPTLSKMAVDLDKWLSGHAAQREANRVKRERQLARQTMSTADATSAATTPAVPAMQVDAERLAPRAEDSASDAALRERVRHVVAAHAQATSGEAVGHAAQSALQAAFLAGYERGVLALNDDKMVRGRLGLGRGGHELAREFLIRPTAASGPLGAALQQREDVFAVLSAPSARALSKDRLLRELKPAHFALLPIVVEEKLLGCLYFDATGDAPAPGQTARELVGVLRDQLAQLFALRQATESPRGTETETDGADAPRESVAA